MLELVVKRKFTETRDINNSTLYILHCQISVSQRSSYKTISKYEVTLLSSLF